MEFEQIRWDVAGAVATITLNRPEKLNAFTPHMGAELVAAFDRADADDAVRAVVLTGSGRGRTSGAADRRGGHGWRGGWVGERGGPPAGSEGTTAVVETRAAGFRDEGWRTRPTASRGGPERTGPPPP